MKTWTSLLLALALVFGHFFTTAPPAVSASEQTGALTVAEALATAQGTEVTMTGYIVAGFNGQYAIEVGDTTTATETIIVKLESGQRATFSPENNPDALNEQIVVTGTRDVYSGQESIESVSEIAFVNETPEEDPAADEDPAVDGDLTILEARNKPVGETVTVQGIVTADGSRTFIQDETAGINLYNQADTVAFAAGDEVKVTGVREDYNGLQEITNYTVEVISSGHSVEPQLVTIDQIDETVEGELIRLENVTIGPINNGGETYLQDENGNTIAVYQIPALDGITRGDTVHVTAVGSEYRGAYQLHVDNAEDVEFVAEGELDSQDTYEVTVTNVVDGDTIHFEPAIFGSDTVRYLNIDTPETYHLNNYDMDLVNSDPDHAQKYHGEQAKEYLNSLLQPGDEIILQVGEEMTDDYGRILAQVIRKSDGLNTNLDMVEKGYAVTYFIWPVGDETVYDQFQSAVKNAKDNNVGIWSDNDTEALELPFAFRARSQGKGFSRYVGNSETMEYVNPENWETVPVEKRIFFASEAEATANGYTAADENNDSPAVASIAEARTQAEGTEVTIEGIVTAKFADTAYIQDETAGIALYGSEMAANVGDEVKVTGQTKDYYGLYELVDFQATVTAAGAGVPEPQTVTAAQLGEELEGQLVTLEMVTVDGDAGYGEYTASDAAGSFIIDNNNFVEIGSTYETITGIVTYNYGNYKLIPRTAEDLVAYTANPEQVLLETLLTGDTAQAEEIAQGYVELIEAETVTAATITSLIEEALTEADNEATAVNRVTKQIDNTLSRVEKGHKHEKVDSLTNRQAQKKFTRILEKDVMDMLTTEEAS